MLFRISLDAQGRLSEPEEFREIVVARSATGTLTRLKDVARVELGANTSLRSLLDNQTAAAIPDYSRTSKQRLGSLHRRARKDEGIGRELPSRRNLHVVYDPTEFISASIDAVVETLFEA